MIINWLGRVFGSNGMVTSGALPLGGLTDVATRASSIVDSDQLAAELARARRYEHDLSVVVLAANPVDGAAIDGNGSSPAPQKLPQMVALLTAVALREVLRFSDVVCYHAAENRFVLALTEVDPAQAQLAMERVESHLRDRLHLHTEIGIAGFPTDAITLDELVTAAAWRAARGERVPTVKDASPRERAITSGGRRGQRALRR